MHVHRLAITDVRQFDHRILEFGPGFNLLVGENGTGKTTILRSLSAVLGTANQTGRRPRLGDEDIRLHSERCQITAEIRQSGGPQQLRYEKRLYQRASRRNTGDALLVLFYGSNEATTSSFASRTVRRYSSEAPRGTSSEEEFLYATERGMDIRDRTAHRFGRSREVRTFVVDALAKISNKFTNFHWRFEPYDCLIRPAEGDGPLPSDFLIGGLRREVASAILRHLQETGNPFGQTDQTSIFIDSSGYVVGASKSEQPVIPKFKELLKRIRLDQPVPGKLESSTFELRLTPRIIIQSSEGEFLLSQLSDGEQRLFSLIVDIARQLSIRGSDFSLNSIPAIVLIDEIDVHLHPKWQRKIVPALEDLFPTCQFIATTHSPFVIQAVDRHKIVRAEDNREVPMDAAANSIEDIAEAIQDIDMPQRSRRAEELSKAAKRYFSLLKRRADAASIELKEAENEYRRASEPFTSEPALHALLMIEKLEAGN